MKTVGVAFAATVALVFLMILIWALVSGTPANERRKKLNGLDTRYSPGSCLTIQEHMVYCKQ